jgi:hypothetical protein
MRARQFDQLLRGLVHLTRRQRDRLLALLQSAAGLDRVLEIVGQPATPPSCPHCRAGHPAYPAFARDVGIAHEALNTRAGERRRGALHIQNVNAYHSRVRAWLVPFRGIASRYLSHYFGWHWALDGDRVPDADAFLRAALGRFNT